MVKLALFVRLEAKPGKEKDVESFLLSGLPLVQAEPATTAWFGIRLGPSTFGIFDAFPDEAGREAHLSGKVAAALMEKAGELFAKPPSIEKIDVLAAKLPGWASPTSRSNRRLAAVASERSSARALNARFLESARTALGRMLPVEPSTCF